jgi:hypothetical protein
MPLFLLFHNSKKIEINQTGSGDFTGNSSSGIYWAGLICRGIGGSKVK